MQDLVDLLAGRRVDLRAAEGAYWRSFAGGWRQRLSVWQRVPAAQSVCIAALHSSPWAVADMQRNLWRSCAAGRDGHISYCLLSCANILHGWFIASRIGSAVLCL